MGRVVWLKRLDLDLARGQSAKPSLPVVLVAFSFHGHLGETQIRDERIAAYEPAAVILHMVSLDEPLLRLLLGSDAVHLAEHSEFVTHETAKLKVRLAEDGWNSRDPRKMALAGVLDYRLIKEVWAFGGNRIAV